MKKYFSLFISILVIAFSIGNSNRSDESAYRSLFSSNTHDNYQLTTSIGFRIVFNFEENLLSSEEEDETIKPLNHLFSADQSACRTMEVFLIPRLFHPATQKVILFEADSSPPSFLG